HSFPTRRSSDLVTKMPLGVSASLVSSSFVIPAQSQNKDAAFAFLEFITFDESAWKFYVERAVQSSWKQITSLPWYQEYQNEYLGVQKEFAFYDTLVDDILIRHYTPLDGPAWPLYIDKINESIDKNIETRTILRQVEDKTKKKLGPELGKLK